MNIHQGNPPKADICSSGPLSRGSPAVLFSRRPTEPRCNINAWRVLSPAAPACIEIARFLVTTVKPRAFSSASRSLAPISRFAAADDKRSNGARFDGRHGSRALQPQRSINRKGSSMQRRAELHQANRRVVAFPY